MTSNGQAREFETSAEAEKIVEGLLAAKDSQKTETTCCLAKANYMPKSVVDLYFYD